MNNIFKIFTLLSIICFIYISCSFDNESDMVADNKGYIQIGLPPLPTLDPSELLIGSEPGGKNMTHLISRKNSDSRMFNYADFLEFTLKDSIGTAIETWPIPRGDGVRVLSVDPGTGYTLEILVYNLSASTLPIIEGVSDPFDVTAGEKTSVQIACFPTNPINTGYDTAYDYTGVPGIFKDDENSNRMVSYGGEQWYTMTAASTITVFEISPDSNSYALIRFFDSTSNLVGYTGSDLTFYEDPGTSFSCTFKTTIGEMYYFVIVPLSNLEITSSTVNFHFSTGPPDDGYEDNNSFLTAAPIPENTTFTGIHFDDDYFSFNVDGSSGLTVKIDINLLNHFCYGFDCDIYDSDYGYMEWGRISFLNEPFAFLLDLPQTGTYYIVITEAYGYGSQYDVMWSYLDE